MKQIKFTLFALAMLIMAGFSSCNKDQDAPVDINGDVVLTVSSTANATRVSGVADNEWDGNEEIGLFCAELDASNAHFSNKNKGAKVIFQPVDQAKDRIILKGSHSGTYTVFAYYPYATDAAADKVAYDLATAGKQPILWAKAADVTRVKPNAAFAFAHKLGKLVINIANDPDVTIGADLAVTLKDAQTKVILNPTTGDVTADTATADLSLNKVGTDNSFYSFVMPSVAADRVLTIVNGGKTYTATLSALAFEANKRYTYTVTLKAQSVVVDNGGESTIGGTTDGGSGNVDASVTPTGITLRLPKEGNVYTANVASAANELTINVTNDNVDNIVLTGADNSWISLKAGQTGVELRAAAKDVFLSIAENTGAARESKITLTIADKTVDFVIKQAAGETPAPATTLSVDKTALTFAATPAGTQDVTVTTNATSWDIEVDATASAWLSATKNGNVITISATEYKDTNADRSGKITVTAGDKTATITVTQTKAVASAPGKFASDLIISEYVEGSSNNKAIEIYNGTGQTVDLSQYSLKKQVNGAGDYTNELTLSGNLEHGKTYVIAHSSASFASEAYVNLSTSSQAIGFNGDDAVGLFKAGVKIDEVGVFNSVAKWGTDVTLVRNSDVLTPNAIYDVNEWTELAKDTFTGLGNHTMNL